MLLSYQRGAVNVRFQQLILRSKLLKDVLRTQAISSNQMIAYAYLDTCGQFNIPLRNSFCVAHQLFFIFGEGDSFVPVCHRTTLNLQSCRLCPLCPGIRTISSSSYTGIWISQVTDISMLKVSFFMWYWMCWTVLSQHKLKSLERKQPRLRKHLQKIQLLDIFLIYD